jgi:hypothetical protein
LRRFEAGFRQQTSVDLPPSSNELIHEYRSINDAAYSCACGTLRVLSDFRKDHGDFFQDCFKQTVKLALELKLASLCQTALKIFH